MRLMKIAGMALLFPILCSCGSKKESREEMPDKQGKIVIFYSQTGTTRQVAEELQQQLGADIDSIVAVDSYGYDYNATIERWKKEREDSVKVEIKPLGRNLNDYDTIFLGFPIWGGTFASPVATWLADNNLEGKTVITFATFGSGGIESATEDVKTVQPGADIREGYGVRTIRIEKAPIEINRFLIEKGLKKGEISPLPEYSDSTPVTPEETEIFNQACGDYKFPLGTPVAVSTRFYDGITDYKFDVKSQSPDGRETNSTVYVTAAPDEKPEFTRVVRSLNK